MALSLKTLFGDPNKKHLKKYQSIPAQVNAFEPAISALSDEALRAKTAEFKAKLATATQNAVVDLEKEKAILAEILPEAFAVVREAAKRTLGQRHFDVQLIGGAILHNGNISEMRTGEGKTLVATLPAYLNALTGRGVHVVTVNDYLSRRDAVWMGQIYAFLGVSTAVINQDSSYVYDPAHKAAPTPVASGATDTLDKERDNTGSFHVVHEFLRPVSRHDAYMADITYGTNNEFGFDYLRDNLEYSTTMLRQRDFNYAIVDEIDSILIDEARTPLIISAPTVESENLYEKFATMVRDFELDTDYVVDEKRKQISLTDKGIEKAQQRLGV
ncbi:MAG: hypothetical protein RIT04_120, partial [Candidatus Parcubacteria bacterium]